MNTHRACSLILTIVVTNFVHNVYCMYMQGVITICQNYNAKPTLVPLPTTFYNDNKKTTLTTYEDRLLWINPTKPIGNNNRPSDVKLASEDLFTAVVELQKRAYLHDRPTLIFLDPLEKYTKCCDIKVYSNLYQIFINPHVITDMIVAQIGIGHEFGHAFINKFSPSPHFIEHNIHRLSTKNNKHREELFCDTFSICLGKNYEERINNAVNYMNFFDFCSHPCINHSNSNTHPGFIERMANIRGLIEHLEKEKKQRERKSSYGMHSGC